MKPERGGLSAIRESFLDSLKDAQVGTDQLFRVLREMKKCQPSVFVECVESEAFDAIELDENEWNARYFVKQLLIVKRNFSVKRLEHLVAVRDVLRRQKLKGFAPKALAAESEVTGFDAKAYNPSKNLEKFVEQKDLLLARTALRMELNDNRLRNEDLGAAVEWAKSRIDCLFEDYEEGAFARSPEENRKAWTPEYYDMQMIYLKTNFSERRFLHMIAVREFLREQQAPGFVAEIVHEFHAEKSSSGGCQPKIERSSNEGPGAVFAGSELSRVLKAALLIGGAIAALVILLVSRS